jgi:hypothetical protein
MPVKKTTRGKPSAARRVAKKPAKVVKTNKSHRIDDLAADMRDAPYGWLGGCGKY